MEGVWLVISDGHLQLYGRGLLSYIKHTYSYMEGVWLVTSEGHLQLYGSGLASYIRRTLTAIWKGSG